MIQSLKLAQLMIRLGLALVFFWFGIDKFIHPSYWMNAWLPNAIASGVEGIGLTAQNFVYLVAIIEVLVGTSLVSTLLMRWFAVVGIVLLAMVMPFQGFSPIFIRDLGLISALLAIIFWPERRF